VFDGLGFELGVLSLSDVGLLSDVGSGFFDGLLEVGNVGFEVSLLNLEDVLQELGGVGDIGVGGIDFTLDSSGFLVVLDGSLLVFLIGSG